MPRISLIIPAFNEEAYLPALLNSVDIARSRYSRGHDEIEVIVADNSSTDRTAEVARTRGCVVAAVAKPAIAASRNGGARVATGEILAFVDADCTIHPETFNVIERTMSSPRVVAGGTSAWFDRVSAGILATTFIGEMLFRLANMDIGVIFCRRSDFETIGGYNEELLCAEDVEILVELKKLGKKRNQRFVRAKGARARTSARKFDSRGDWHYFTMAPPTAIFAMLFNRTALQRQMGAARINEYWYDVRGPQSPQSPQGNPDR
jgi:glycosyltransferase involved in cell wall biosynthesis